jgi:hypothetical protein
MPLTYIEKEWIFEHRQMWEHERELAAAQGRPPITFFTNQPNEIKNNLIREPSVNTNSMSISPPRRIIRNSQLERKHEEKREKEVKKLSEKLNNQDSRNIEVSKNNTRIEYFPMENIIIKGSGSAADPLDITKEDTDLFG